MTNNDYNDIATIRIRSDPSELSSVRESIRRLASTIEFPSDEIDRIILAVDEALANVIRHGYGGPCEQPIDVCIRQFRLDGQPAISITIRDFGKQFDPTAIVSRSLDDVRPGGLGVHIIRTVMDEVNYAPAAGGGMQLTMTKKKKMP